MFFFGCHTIAVCWGEGGCDFVFFHSKCGTHGTTHTKHAELYAPNFMYAQGRIKMPSRMDSSIRGGKGVFFPQ